MAKAEESPKYLSGRVLIAPTKNKFAVVCLESPYSPPLNPDKFYRVFKIGYTHLFDVNYAQLISPPKANQIVLIEKNFLNTHDEARSFEQQVQRNNSTINSPEQKKEDSGDRAFRSLEDLAKSRSSLKK